MLPIRVIYLDQNHLSNIARSLMKPGVLRQYDQLHGVLQKAVQEGQLICPYSSYHVLETSRCEDADLRNAICSVVKHFSKEFCFKWFQEVIVEEIIYVIDKTYSVGPEPPIPSAIGRKFDCFPVHTQVAVDAYLTDKGFRELVNLSGRVRLAQVEDSLVEYWRKDEERRRGYRQERRLNYQQALKIGTDLLWEDIWFKGLVGEAAHRRGLDLAMVYQILKEDNLSGLPT